MTALHAGPPLANGLQPLSCLRCAYRKVRCDRLAPCSNCTKHGVLCEFPQPKTERRQRRKVVSSSSSTSKSSALPQSSRNKLRARLDHYREVLKDMGVDVEAMPDSPRQTAADPPSMRDSTPPPETVDSTDVGAGVAAVSGGGRLIVAGNRSRYIEGNLWSRTGEDLHGGAILPDSSSDEEEDDDEAMTDSTTGHKAGGLTLGLSPGTPPSLTENHFPTQQDFRQLWQIYLANIHPVTMILHPPSASEALSNAAKNPGNASKDVKALLLAVMACALISINDAECVRSLGEKRAVLFSRYRIGCEIALNKANFLQSSNLCVLQAYAIYLVAISPHVDASELWNLTGIAKRNAQRLGLHQELSTAGLTPFEVEMRRRLWSQILMLDAMAAQSANLYRPDPSCEVTTATSNVNDSDLSPGMKSPPKERAGATDMIFCNLRHKVMKFMGTVNGGKRPWALAAGEAWTAAVEQLYHAEREKAVAEMEEELELELLRYCDMLNPVHFLTVIEARLTLCKLRYTILLQPYRHDRSSNQGGSAFKDQGRDLLFSRALKVLEYENNANSQPSIQGFLWHTHQHFQWSCLRQLLEDLKTRPSSERADRAWEQIRLFYESRPHMYETAKRKLAPLHRGINKATLEAWHKRESEAAERSQSLALPTYITALREQEHSERSKGRKASRFQDLSRVNASQPPRDRGVHTTTSSTSSNVVTSAAMWPGWAEFHLEPFGASGHEMDFVDPALDQQMAISVVQNHDSNRYAPHQDFLAPLDQYVHVGERW